MKKIVLIIMLFLMYTNLLAKNEKNILIINSYHSGYEWSDRVIHGMQSVFKKDTNMCVTVLYMDSKRITSKEYYESLKKLYTIQLKNRKFDLVVAIDRFAFDFILKNYYKFFTNEKVLAVGIERFSKKNIEKYNLESKVSALLERRALKSNINLIKTMIPDLKKLYILNDSSKNGDHTHPFIQEAIDEIDGTFPVEYIRRTSKEELRDFFRKKRDDEALLFIRFYKNKYNDFLENNQISEVLKQINVPIFVTDSLFLNSSILGGKIVHLKSLGRSAGVLASNIVNNSIEKPIVKVDKSIKYIFDYNNLSKFNLSVPNIKRKNYEIINAPTSFFEKYRKFIDGVFLLSPLLVLLIMGLIHNIYFRKKSEKSLKDRVEFDEVLLNSIDNPIFWQDSKGFIVDANEYFCKLINLPYHLICTHRLEDFYQMENIKKLLDILDDYKSGKLENSTFTFINKEGEKEIYLIKQKEYMTSNVVTVFTNITKEKKFEREKNKNQEFIIQQSKLAEIGEVFSSIAHQWKSPLVNITAIAQDFFYSNSSSKDESESEHLNEIMKQVSYMTDTMYDFQNFISPSKKRDMFNIEESIDSVLNIINHSIKYNYIKVEKNICNQCKLKVFGYKNEFMQCLLNIINNAKDALIENNNIKNRNISINVYNNEDKKVVIEICDNAGGIKKGHLEKIFDSYYTTKDSGHGIGLYMCKVIIEDKMHGKITAFNNEKGACFKINLG